MSEIEKDIARQLRHYLLISGRDGSQVPEGAGRLPVQREAEPGRAPRHLHRAQGSGLGGHGLNSTLHKSQQSITILH